MLIQFLSYFIILIKATLQSSVIHKIEAVSTIIGIFKAGKGLDIEFICNDSINIYWSHKFKNGYYEEFSDGDKSIRTYSSKTSLAGSLNSCRLHITTLEFKDAGTYSCWNGSVEVANTNLIVIDNDATCSIIPNSLNSENILLDGNTSVIIKCNFIYSADESCIVTPIWIDLTGYKDLTIPGEDYKIKMNKENVSLLLNPGVDLRNGTNFNLTVAFNCSSSSNNTQNKHIRPQGQYYFAPLPFTFYVKYNTGTIFFTTKQSVVMESTLEFKNKKTDANYSSIISLITTGILSAISSAVTIAIVVVLVFVCRKKFSTLFRSNYM